MIKINSQQTCEAFKLACQWYGNFFFQFVIGQCFGHDIIILNNVTRCKQGELGARARAKVK